MLKALAKKLGVDLLLTAINQRLPPPVASALYSIARYPTKDTREPFFDEAFRAIAHSGIEGDYLEFGVYGGGSFMMAPRLARKHGLGEMRFFAFDSFQGLPESEGHLSRGDFSRSRDSFVRNLRKFGVDTKRVGTTMTSLSRLPRRVSSR